MDPLTRVLSTVVLIVAVSRVAPARANPAEVFGFGSRHAGKAGAVAASCDDFAAGYYNPAGLAFGAGKRLTLGVAGFASNLAVNDDRVSITEPVGLVIGATTPAPLGGPLAGRLHIGIGLYLLPATVVQVIARFPDEPFYPYYDNRTQRIVVLPTIAVRVRDDLSIGATINYLATLDGKVVSSEGATRALEARVDEEIPSVARINAGLRWRPGMLGGDFDLALVFRQEFSIPFATAAENQVAGEPIDLDISADGLYTPMQLVAGTSWHPAANRELSVDLTWARWSAYPGPYVEVRSALPLVGPLVGEIPEVPFRDVFGIRVGGEVFLPAWRAGAGYALRGGYAFETSAVPPEQPGVTNLLDGNKNTVALGFGVLFPDAMGGHPVRLDLHARAQLVSRRTIRKVIDYDPDNSYDSFTALRDEVADDPGSPESLGAQISNPGYPDLRSGGQVYSGGITAEVGF